MRGKIIAVFSVVVLVVGGLTYALIRASLGDLSTPGEAPRALAAAGAQLHLEGVLLERWVAAQVADAKLRDPFNAGTPAARAEAATELCNKMREAGAAAPELAGTAPALVALVDKQGVVLGRNGSALMRGDNLGAIYPLLRGALDKGATGSDAWINRARNEQLFASYAPIRGADGAVIGGLVAGTAINNERLTRASERTSGHILVMAAKGASGLDVVASSAGATPEILGTITASQQPLQALTSGQSVELAGLPADMTGASHPLDGYGDGRRAVLIAIAKLQTVGLLAGLIWPAIGAIVLGLVLVVIGGFLLDAYISRPISELEEGLLAVMNGRTDLRFEIEHAELGGLVFRINSLLNQLLGVQEDDTDEQGRPSHAPRAGDFKDALEVDETMAAGAAADVAEAKHLREEADNDYYTRIFREYVEAKRSLGDPTDHITKEAFTARIMESERDTAQKHGKPVRYKVEVRGREVVLLAVPLA
jgi:hypothetical protein